MRAHPERLPYPSPGCWCDRCAAERERLRRVWERGRARRSAGPKQPPSRRPGRPPGPSTRRRPAPVRVPPVRRGSEWLCCACLRYSELPMLCAPCRDARPPIESCVRFDPARLRAWLERRNWYLQQLASILGCSPAWASEVWQGHHPLRIERARSLARAAGVTLPGLLRATGGTLLPPARRKNGRHPREHRPHSHPKGPGE